MLNRREMFSALLISALTAVSLSITFAPRAFAITGDALAQTIYKAKILAPGTQLKVHVKGDQALISSFRNERANDKDCKIEALLVGKTVFDIPNSGITNITYYFFNNRQPNEYKAANIRTTDVRAFEGGEVNQDTLLSSIELKPGKVQDATTALESRMMLAAAGRRDVTIVDKGEDIEVSCKMPPLSDEEYKFEAFKIAETASKYGNSAAKRIRIVFFKPGERGNFKQVSISMANLNTIEKRVSEAFDTLQLSEGTAKLTVKDIEPSDGPLMAQRTTLLESIQRLEDKGVGVAPFIAAYQSIDSKAAQGDESNLDAEIKRLSDIVGEQEKRYQDAKIYKPTKDKGPEETDKGPRRIGGDIKKTASKGVVTRWALGFFPMPESEILRDPNSYMADCKQKFEEQLKKAKAPAKSAEQDSRYPLALMWVAEVLKTNDRATEAKKFEDQARALAARQKMK